jgi:hypothetical protein
MADQNDLTTNVNIANDDNSKLVTVTTDGSKERLDVSAKVENDGQGYAENGFLFVSLIDPIVIGSSEVPVFFIKNPVSSGFDLYIQEYIFVTAKASQAIEIRIYANNTTTADGTALTELNKNLNSGTTASATTFKSPTVSAYGDQYAIFGVAGAGESRHIEEFTFVIGEGDDMIISAQASSANTQISMMVTWAEVEI